MKMKHLISAAAAVLMLALTGCGMKEEDAVRFVQEKLDEAAAAQTDQELQDLILEGAPGLLTGSSAENSLEALAGIRSAMSFTASAAEKTEDGFTVTVDAVPVSIEISDTDFLETYKEVCLKAGETGLSPEDTKGEAFGEMAGPSFLELAAQNASAGESARYTVFVTAKKEADQEAVSEILQNGISVTWPEFSETGLMDCAAMFIYDLPGTYVGTADLTERVAAELDKTFGVKSEGTILMDMYLVLNSDFTMDFYTDSARFVQAIREYYDKNLDKWLASQGSSVENLIRSGRFASRDAILDFLIRSAGYDEESGSVPSLDALSFSGAWYYEDGAVQVAGKADRFVRQEDGSLLTQMEGVEVPFVRQ